MPLACISLAIGWSGASGSALKGTKWSGPYKIFAVGYDQRLSFWRLKALPPLTLDDVTEAQTREGVVVSRRFRSPLASGSVHWQAGALVDVRDVSSMDVSSNGDAVDVIVAGQGLQMVRFHVRSEVEGPAG